MQHKILGTGWDEGVGIGEMGVQMKWGGVGVNVGMGWGEVEVGVRIK